MKIKQENILKKLFGIKESFAHIAVVKRHIRTQERPLEKDCMIALIARNNLQ
jgi:hypothetical protein